MQEYEYRTFGAAGQVQLNETHVRTVAKSYQGWYEQSVPYEALNPIHGTLKTTPQGLFIFIGFAAMLIIVGLLALLNLAETTIQIAMYSYLVLFGLYLFWYVPKFMNVEWTIFYTNAGGRGVSYPQTRGKEDEFTKLTSCIQQRIEMAKKH